MCRRRSIVSSTSDSTDGVDRPPYRLGVRRAVLRVGRSAPARCRARLLSRVAGSRRRTCRRRPVASAVAPRSSVGTCVRRSRGRRRPAGSDSLPLTRSAAAASSSARAVTVTSSRWPNVVVVAAQVLEHLDAGRADRGVDDAIAPRPAHRVGDDHRDVDAESIAAGPIGSRPRTHPGRWAAARPSRRGRCSRRCRRPRARSPWRVCTIWVRPRRATTRTVSRGEVVLAAAWDETALGLGDDLAGHDDDVSVAQLDAGGDDQRRDVVAFGRPPGCPSSAQTSNRCASPCAAPVARSSAAAPSPRWLSTSCISSGTARPLNPLRRNAATTSASTSSTSQPSIRPAGLGGCRSGGDARRRSSRRRSPRGRRPPSRAPARHRRSATARQPGRAVASQRVRRCRARSRMMPIDTTGLLGASSTTSASAIASMTPGAGLAGSQRHGLRSRAAGTCRAQSGPTTPGSARRTPSASRTCVSSQSSLAGNHRHAGLPALAQPPGDGRQRHSVGEPAAAQQVGREVEVAETEPRRARVSRRPSTPRRTPQARRGPGTTRPPGPSRARPTPRHRGCRRCCRGLGRSAGPGPSCRRRCSRSR